MHLAFFLVCQTFVADFNVLLFYLSLFFFFLFRSICSNDGTFLPKFILEYFDYTRKRIIFILSTYTLYDFAFSTVHVWKNYTCIFLIPCNCTVTFTTRTLYDTFNNATRYTTLKSLVTFQLDRMWFLRYFNFSGYMYIALFIVCNLSR